jgi:hypothetical protein
MGALEKEKKLNLQCSEFKKDFNLIIANFFLHTDVGGFLQVNLLHQLGEDHLECKKNLLRVAILQDEKNKCEKTFLDGNFARQEREREAFNSITLQRNIIL